MDDGGGTGGVRLGADRWVLLVYRYAEPHSMLVLGWMSAMKDTGPEGWDCDWLERRCSFSSEDELLRFFRSHDLW